MLFKGNDTVALGAHRKVAMGLALIPEGRLIFADQTVDDNLILGAYTRWSRERASGAVRIRTDIRAFSALKERMQQRAGSLSGGEQQMLAIGRGLLSKPTLLMIDELSLGLAPKIVEQLMGLLRDLNAQGQTILLVEQLASYALAIPHQAYVIGHGRIQMHGPANSRTLPDVMAAFLGKKRNSPSNQGECDADHKRVVDLSLLIEDNMPAHKLFQRPVITTHMSHESAKALNLGMPERCDDLPDQFHRDARSRGHARGCIPTCEPEGKAGR